MEDRTNDPRISRRGFLKLGLAALPASALLLLAAGCVEEEEDDDEEDDD